MKLVSYVHVNSWVRKMYWKRKRTVSIKLRKSVVSSQKHKSVNDINNNIEETDGRLVTVARANVTHLVSQVAQHPLWQHRWVQTAAALPVVSACLDPLLNKVQKELQHSKPEKHPEHPDEMTKSTNSSFLYETSSSEAEAEEEPEEDDHDVELELKLPSLLSAKLEHSGRVAFSETETQVLTLDVDILSRKPFLLLLPFDNPYSVFRIPYSVSSLLILFQCSDGEPGLLHVHHHFSQTLVVRSSQFLV